MVAVIVPITRYSPSNKHKQTLIEDATDALSSFQDAVGNDHGRRNYFVLRILLDDRRN